MNLSRGQEEAGMRQGGGWEEIGRLGGAWEEVGRRLGGGWEEAGRRLAGEARVNEGGGGEERGQGGEWERGRRGAGPGWLAPGQAARRRQLGEDPGSHHLGEQIGRVVGYTWSTSRGGRVTSSRFYKCVW